MNLPTGGNHSAYYTAVTEADDTLEDALGHIRARQDDGEITPAEACTERVDLLERHLAECRQLRIRHLGASS